MERTDPMTIRQIIDRVIDRSASRDEFLGYRASALWPDVVGPGVNHMTTRRYFRDGELHVYISSAPMKAELSFSRERIAASINDILGREVLRKIILH